MINAHEFKGLYDELFDFREAGYVMLDTHSPFIDKFETDLEYVSPDPTKYWMKGLSKEWHVTVRGPLDPKVRQWHCKEVLSHMRFPDELELDGFEVFPSPYPDEPYDCIVVRVNDDRLRDFNQQLSVLPGVVTYPEYKPHLTIGYFQAGHSDELVDELLTKIGVYVDTKNWNFGRMKP